MAYIEVNIETWGKLNLEDSCWKIISPIFPCKCVRRNMQLSSKVQKFTSVIPTLKTRITARDGDKARSYF